MEQLFVCTQQSQQNFPLLLDPSHDFFPHHGFFPF